MKIVKLTVDDKFLSDGVDAVALVEMPAIEEDFFAFKHLQFESYTDYPESAVNAAKRALAWVEEHGWGDCGTPVGKARANQLANREPISEETIARMAAFARHLQYEDVPYSEGCGGLMVDAWGGRAGIEWASRKLEEIRQGFEVDVTGLAPYVNQTTGSVIVSQDMQEESPANIDVYGYETKNFEICPGAIALMEHLKTMDLDQDTMEMVRAAAIIADALFAKEKEVTQKGEANHEDLVEALAIAADFESVMQEVDKLTGMTHDISWVMGHIEVIKSYMPTGEVPEATMSKIERFAEQLADKQMIVGPLMVPNKLILRLDENNDPYYVYFTADTIEQIARKFMKNKYGDSVNIEHDMGQKVDGVYLAETWIVEDPEKDKATLYGFEPKEGTWMGIYKVENRDIWNEYVKSGRVRGFSVEGYFANKLIEQSKEAFVHPGLVESHDDFIQRCMGDSKMNSEFPENDQRYAVCESYWSER